MGARLISEAELGRMECIERVRFYGRRRPGDLPEVRDGGRYVDCSGHSWTITHMANLGAGFWAEKIFDWDGE